MAARNRGCASHGGAAYEQYMESENDALINGLSGKVTQLKELTIAIGSDVREQNNMLNNLNSSFDSTGGLLGSTMKRLNGLAKSGGDCTMTYLAVFVFLVFLVLWKLTR